MSNLSLNMYELYNPCLCFDKSGLMSHEVIKQISVYLRWFNLVILLIYDLSHFQVVVKL